MFQTGVSAKWLELQFIVASHVIMYFCKIFTVEFLKHTFVVRVVTVWNKFIYIFRHSFPQMFSSGKELKPAFHFWGFQILFWKLSIQIIYWRVMASTSHCKCILLNISVSTEHLPDQLQRAPKHQNSPPAWSWETLRTTMDKTVIHVPNALLSYSAHFTEYLIFWSTLTSHL